MAFDDFFNQDEFLIDPDDLYPRDDMKENWDTGIPTDIFTSGEPQDIFSTIVMN